MMNGNYGGMYNAYQQPYSTTLSTFDRVSGIEQAKAYTVPIGTSVMLMDINEPRFYIKTNDITGMVPPLRIYEFKEVTEAPAAVDTKEEKVEYATKEDFNALLSELKELRKSESKKGNK